MRGRRGASDAVGPGRWATMAGMSLLTRPSSSGATDSTEQGVPTRRPPAVLGLVAGVRSVLIGLFAAAVPCLVVWLAAPRVSASWVDAVRVGVDAWLLAHGATVVLAHGEISLVPLGLTVVPLLLCRSAGRRVARALLDAADDEPARTLPARHVVAAGAGLTGAYALLAALVAVAVATPGAHPLEGQAALGGLVVAGLGAGAGLWPALGRRTWPAAVTVPVRAALIAVTGWLAASALLLAAALVLGWSRASELAAALDAGVVGGTGLLLVQLALLPVAVLWAGAWWAGAGFAVGAGTAVTPAATGVGVVPALPLLGALPAPGTHPGWLSVAIAVPVLCGVPAGRWLRSRSRGPRLLLRDTLVTAALVVAASAVLFGWASGAAGAGRMADLGPQPLWAALALGGEVLAGCSIGILTATAPLGARRGPHNAGPDADRHADRHAGPSDGTAPSWLPEAAWARLPAWARRPLRLRLRRRRVRADGSGGQ